MTLPAPGEYIRRRREARGLTLEQLALSIDSVPRVSARARAELLGAIENGVQPLSIELGLLLHRALRFDWIVLVKLAAIAAGLEKGELLPRICRVCACSEYDPCLPSDRRPCRWSGPDLCSACAREVAA